MFYLGGWLSEYWSIPIDNKTYRFTQLIEGSSILCFELFEYLLYGIFVEGSRNLTNQKLENSAFSSVIG